MEADSAWSLQILRVERLDAPCVIKRAMFHSGARRLRVPFRVGDPPQGDDPFLLSSGLAGFLGALNRTRGDGSATKVCTLATVTTSSHVVSPQPYQKASDCRRGLSSL